MTVDPSPVVGPAPVPPPVPASQPAKKPPAIPLLVKDSASAASSSTAVFDPPSLTKPLPGQLAGNPFSTPRTNESYDALLEPDNRHDIFDPIKRIQIGPDKRFYVSLGGEVRERYELFNNFNFGPQPQDHNGYTLTRLYGLADIHLGQDVRFFIETKSSLVTQRNGGPRPTDADELDVDQAFGEFNLPFDKDNSLTFRGGRQYLLYGAQRLVSPLDWSNTRRTFDGFKLSLVSASSPVAKNYLDAFWTRPVIVDKEMFNNDDHNSAFWGVYDTVLLPKVFSEKAKTGVDAYFLGLHQRSRPALFVSAPIAASQDVYTIGTRVSTAPAPWDTDCEFDYQFGRTGSSGGQISAYSVALDGGWTFDAPLAPRVNLGFDIASGDNGTGNTNLTRFNQLFPLGHSYLGYIDVVGRENIIDLHPGLTVTLLQDNPIGKSMSFKAENHIFWRQNTNDALFNAAGGVQRAVTGSNRRYVGDEIDLLLNWQVDKHLSGYVGYSHFFTGGFINTTGDHNSIDFLYVAANYSF